MAPLPPHGLRSAHPAHWPSNTHWSIILTAADTTSPGAQHALEQLCRAYWYPVYAYVRHHGHARPDAEDLTQSFFKHLIESHALAAARPERGRFRAFVRVSLDHFVISEWRRETALKRGGGGTVLSWDGGWAEARYQREEVCELTPERLYERSWALTLLQRVLDSVKAELVAEGRGLLFTAIKDRLMGDPEAGSYAELARQVGAKESALKKTVQRLRHRYGQILRQEVAHTVASPDEVDDELRHLLAVVSA